MKFRRPDLVVWDPLTSSHFAIDPIPASVQLPLSVNRVPVRYTPYNGRSVVPRWTWEKTDRPRVAVRDQVCQLGARPRGAKAGDVVVLRVSDVYGPDPAAGSFLGFLSAKLHTVDPDVGLELTIADARRDYVDSRDVARAVLLAARLPVSRRVFNIGG